MEFMDKNLIIPFFHSTYSSPHSLILFPDYLTLPVMTASLSIFLLVILPSVLVWQITNGATKLKRIEMNQTKQNGIIVCNRCKRVVCVQYSDTHDTLYITTVLISLALLPNIYKSWSYSVFLFFFQCFESATLVAPRGASQLGPISPYL